MKFTGISRTIDELGRIVIPKEIRNALELHPKDEIEIYIEGGNMIMKKAVSCCALCGAREELFRVENGYICSSCAEKIKAGAIL